MLKRIQLGEPEITVDTNVAAGTTSFSSTGKCLVVTHTSGKVSSVVSRSGANCTSGASDQTWSYTYDGASCLRTATGPAPASPSQSIVWTYTYKTGTGGSCTTEGQLRKVERQVGAGPTVEIASWAYFTNGRVRSVKEPALDQTLCLGYSGTGANLTTAVCPTPASGACDVPSTNLAVSPRPRRRSRHSSPTQVASRVSRALEVRASMSR